MREEIPLHGGNVADSVVRIGTTVRKPSGPSTPAVEALLRHLRAVGFAHAPRTFGRDEQGRHVLEYIPGALADTLPALDPPGLARIGRIIRELHDATGEFIPPADAMWNVVIPPDAEELICHNDLAPWNLVVSADRWVFIDWDAAGPGSVGWDLDYAATGFIPFAAENGDPSVDGPRLRSLVDGYGMEESGRERLAAMLGEHAQGMCDLLTASVKTGAQPWARLHSEGHAGYWGPAAEYIRGNRETWRRALLG